MPKSTEYEIISLNEFRLSPDNPDSPLDYSKLKDKLNETGETGFSIYMQIEDGLVLTKYEY